MTGIVALVGSGEYLPTMEEVDRRLIRSLDRPARVICLPTAAGEEGPARIQYWSDLGVAHFSRLGVEVEAIPVIDRSSADDQDYADRIRQANFIYLSGGRPAYLYHVLAGSRVWTAIRTVLDGGGILVGCSAGAMILGERFPGFPSLLRWHEGFHLVPNVVIVPHFDEISETFLQLIKSTALREGTLIGIEGHTALIRADGRNVVSGTGGVTVWSPRQKTRYLNGQELTWP